MALDTDGNSFSGSYCHVLVSKRAVLKQTIIKEWHIRTGCGVPSRCTHDAAVDSIKMNNTTWHTAMVHRRSSSMSWIRRENRGDFCIYGIVDKIKSRPLAYARRRRRIQKSLKSSVASQTTADESYRRFIRTGTQRAHVIQARPSLAGQVFALSNSLASRQVLCELQNRRVLFFPRRPVESFLVGFAVTLWLSAF
jgi:hypothetical protein